MHNTCGIVYRHGEYQTMKEKIDRLCGHALQIAGSGDDRADNMLIQQYENLLKFILIVTTELRG